MAGRPIDMKARERQERRVDAAIAKIDAAGEKRTKAKIAEIMNVSRSLFTSNGGYIADYVDSILGTGQKGTAMTSDAEKITSLEDELVKMKKKLENEKEKHRKDNILHNEKITNLQTQLLDEKIKNEELRGKIYEQDKMRRVAM